MQVGWILHSVCIILARDDSSCQGATFVINECNSTVNIVLHPGRGSATRPSDALIGKLIKGTATDWVTRGPLNHKPTERRGMGAECTVGPVRAESLRRVLLQAKRVSEKDGTLPNLKSSVVHAIG